jgi:hypothetical protein
LVNQDESHIASRFLTACAETTSALYPKKEIGSIAVLWRPGNPEGHPTAAVQILSLTPNSAQNGPKPVQETNAGQK